MNRLKRSFSTVLCVLLTVLAAGFILPIEGEAATGRAVRAPIRAPITPPRAGTPAAAPQAFASGAGTQGNPFVIRTAAQLSAFAASVSGGESYAGIFIRLGSNIDLRNVAWAPIGVHDRDGVTNPFSGTFYGAGFTIYNMGAGNDARSPGGPLFGALNGAAIERVNLQFVNVNGDDNVGGLVGFKSRSTLRNSLVSGTVRGRFAVGGIVGSSVEGFLENCNFSGIVEGDSGVGGMVGAVDRTAIRFGNIIAQVNGSIDVGGFVGGVLEGTIIQSTANDTSVNGDLNVGGFVGNMINGGMVDRSTFNGQVRGNAYVGGIVGAMTSGFIVGNTVAGSVKGRTHTGGIVGDLVYGEVRRCVSTASVNGMTYIGGLVGRMSGGDLRNNANHGDVSGGRAVGGLIGNFDGWDPTFSLTLNRNTGPVRGHFNTGPLVGLVRSEE